MANVYKFTADAQVTPAVASTSASGVQAIDTPLDENLTLSLNSQQVIELISDSPVSVQLPGPSASVPGAPQANVIIIKAIGPRVKASITSADGAAQVIPVDPLLVLHSISVSPITSLSLTRTPGNDTLVHVFLGQI